MLARILQLLVDDAFFCKFALRKKGSFAKKVKKEERARERERKRERVTLLPTITKIIQYNIVHRKF